MIISTSKSRSVTSLANELLDSLRQVQEVDDSSIEKMVKAELIDEAVGTITVRSLIALITFGLLWIPSIHFNQLF